MPVNLVTRNWEIHRIHLRMDEVMDEIDGLSHASEREQLETLMGEYQDLINELEELEVND